MEFLGLIAVPPTSGFHSEWMIFSGAFHEAIVSHSMEKLFLAFSGITATFLTACYALWTIRRIFFGTRPEHLDHATEAPISTTIPMLVLSATSILVGLARESLRIFCYPQSPRLGMKNKSGEGDLPSPRLGVPP